MPNPGHARQLFVGLGSFHGDDQLGWLLADHLNHLVPVRQAAMPPDLLHWLEGVEELFICDACQGSGKLGTLHRWEYRHGADNIQVVMERVATLRSTSSHHLRLSPVLQLAQQLGILPKRVVVWAVEGSQFQAGQAMSVELKQQLPGIAQQLAEEISHA